jgi:hypothetical protein
LAPKTQAFCGFYVSGADAKLFNNATNVVLMREGTRTVLSMQNNYEGPPENFAMVVPVPVVLQKENVKTLPKDIFEKVDKLTAPRLVEYWEQDPCGGGGTFFGPMTTGVGGGGMARAAASTASERGVTIEAEFSVGEYDIVILSAKDSTGLDGWLRDEHYKIPAGAEPFLRPYVQSGSKFFVARVDPKRVKFEKGQAELSPLRFHYDSQDFSLPVRLGLINSNGAQDLIVNILAADRYEPANYPSVTIPTNLDLAEGSKDHFGRFYAALFDRTLEKNPRAIVTEYSWDAGTCDPCPGPALYPQDYAQLGADVLPSAGKPTQPHVNMEKAKGPSAATGGSSTLDLIPKRFKSRVDQCWAKANEGKTAPKTGTIEVNLAWAADGKAKSVALGKNETDDKELGECVRKSFDNALFPSGEEGGSLTVGYSMTLVAPPSYTNFTVTRLHARYTKESLGQDIIFRKAKPIVGGREDRDDKGHLSMGAKPMETGSNNFQGRYAIRHPWVGPMDCKEPRRGVWGGPWYDVYGWNGQQLSQPVPASKTAFVPRGGVTLTNFVRTDVPELDVKAGKGPLPVTAAVASAGSSPGASSSSSTAPASSSSTTPPNKGCGGCATSSSSSSSIDLGLGMLSLWIVGRIRRRHNGSR